IVTNITVSSGTGFQLQPPLLPNTLATQGNVEFHIFFNPAGTGPYIATLAINNIGVTIISATVKPGALVSFGTALLSVGGTADFGQIEIGTSAMKTFTMTNPGSTPFSINVVSVTGDAFRGPTGN